MTDLANAPLAPWGSFYVIVGSSAAALLLGTAAQAALYVIGAAALGLLLIGIHSAWDTVTQVVVTGADGDAAKKE